MSILFRPKRTALVAGVLAVTLAATGVAPFPAGASAEPLPAGLMAQVADGALSTLNAVEVPADRYGVRVDGVPMTTDPQVRTIGGQTYVSLRAVAQALLPGAQITWERGSAVVSQAGVVHLRATPGQKYLVANERYLYAPEGVQKAEGSVLVPLKVLCKALDAACVIQPNGTIDLSRGAGGLTLGQDFYDEDDLYWLSHIIYAESGNQPLSGKIAVGNVVMNRVADSRFASTIKGVIFQKNQFSPAASGTIYRTPNAESVIAAKLVLDGAVALENVLYFNRVGLNCWASRNRPMVATIAGHSFYA